MDIVGAWGAEVGVSVSTSKTAIMLLKGQLSRTRRPTVRFAGASLPYVTKCRYLGILVGERLSYLCSQRSAGWFALFRHNLSATTVRFVSPLRLQSADPLIELWDQLKEER